MNKIKHSIYQKLHTAKENTNLPLQPTTWLQFSSLQKHSDWQRNPNDGYRHDILQLLPTKPTEQAVATLLRCLSITIYLFKVIPEPFKNIILTCFYSHHPSYRSLLNDS